MSHQEPKKTRVLLISSSGGHWVQMNRLKPALEGNALFFACTDKSYEQVVTEGKFFAVPEASQTSSKFTILAQAFCVLFILLKIKPHAIITTGAAPGFFALFFGRFLKIKTVWLDSIANVDEPSLSGRKAAKYADLYLTQWQHLAGVNGLQYFGSVI